MERLDKRVRHLKYRDRVTHKKYGYGMVIGEWGSMTVEQKNGKTISCGCLGIYDVEFKSREGEPFLHCCRIQYLKTI